MMLFGVLRQCRWLILQIIMIMFAALPNIQYMCTYHALLHIYNKYVTSLVFFLSFLNCKKKIVRP